MQPITPRLSAHARERCAEMGVVTRRAKRVVQHADVRRPGRPGDAEETVLATWSKDPDIAVVYAEGSPPTIITVVWRTVDDYTRVRGGFIARDRD